MLGCIGFSSSSDGGIEGEQSGGGNGVGRDGDDGDAGECN